MSTRTKPTHFRVHMSVQGPGMFPVDMLRYESAVPRTENDANAIATSIFGTPLEHEIKLVRYVQPGMSIEPNRERWKSFGWEVIRVEPVTDY